MENKKNNSTEKGRSYEKCVRAYCRRKKLTILKQNLRVKRTEIDCLAWDSNLNQYVIIEVRGRSNSKFPPSKFISPQKLKRLKDFAMSLVFREKKSVRLYLLEVIGVLPKAHLNWGLEIFPEKLGLQMQDYQIDL